MDDISIPRLFKVIAWSKFLNGVALKKSYLRYVVILVKDDTMVGESIHPL